MVISIYLFIIFLVKIYHIVRSVDYVEKLQLIKANFFLLSIFLKNLFYSYWIYVYFFILFMVYETLNWIKMMVITMTISKVSNILYIQGHTMLVIVFFFFSLCKLLEIYWCQFFCRVNSFDSQINQVLNT